MAAVWIRIQISVFFSILTSENTVYKVCIENFISVLNGSSSADEGRYWSALLLGLLSCRSSQYQQLSRSADDSLTARQPVLMSLLQRDQEAHWDANHTDWGVFCWIISVSISERGFYLSASGCSCENEIYEPSDRNKQCSWCVSLCQRSFQETGCWWSRLRNQTVQLSHSQRTKASRHSRI